MFQLTKSETDGLRSQFATSSSRLNKLVAKYLVHLLTLMLTMFAIACNAQTFLSKYPKLTKSNLNEFFSDWKMYSDSVSANTNNILPDIMITEIFRWHNQDSLKDADSTEIHMYRVIPQLIEVERFYCELDTLQARCNFGFPVYTLDLKEDQYVRYDVLAPLPPEGLYLTTEIYHILSRFAGGLKNGEKFEKINEKNVRKLQQYIPVDYGHWGGYWWFTSFPIITDISYADNLIAVARRTSWCTGEVIWYLKENGKFVRQPEPKSSWIE